MKKILFLTDLYFPEPSPVGICTHEIMKDFVKKGYQVHCVCYRIGNQPEDEEFEGIYVHRVKPRWFFQLRSYGEKNITEFKGKIVLSLQC